MDGKNIPGAPSAPEDYIRVTLAGIDPDLWARFKAQAAMERREVRELAADAFSLYLAARVAK